MPALSCPPDLLLIRSDAGPGIGHGHVARCRALAQAWLQAGGRALFLQAEAAAGLAARLAEDGIESRKIQAAIGSSEDAAATIHCARETGARWVVADGYALGPDWQRQVAEAGLRLLAVDDHGHAGRYHGAMILNQNLSAQERWYAQRDASARLLLGPRFALLRQEFLEWTERRLDPAPLARRVLVTCGGSDADNVTAMALSALGRLPGTEATVVVGGSNPHLSSLRQAAGALGPRVRLEVDTAAMPALMAGADVALSAAGSTAWELAFMGLPSALAVLADNQAGIAAGLEGAGAALNLGPHRDLNPEKIADALRLLLEDHARRREMSARARGLVDGHGARRVAAALGARLRITLVSDGDSWSNPSLAELKSGFEAEGHAVRWVHDPAEMPEGDLAFLLSLGQLVRPSVLRRHAHNLVVHASDLPRGRGWSPLTWQILEGKSEIPITLFEAGESVDSGEIYAQDILRFRGNELVSELRRAQSEATLRLCRRFVAEYPFLCAAGRSQSGAPSRYPRRRPADSRLDPDKTLREQFNLLRVSDPDRYPAFFEIAGRRFQVRVTAETGPGTG